MALEHLLVIDPVLGNDRELNLGRIAEDLIFYSKVQLHVRRGALSELIQGVGAEALLELMARGALTVVYVNNVVSVHTRLDGVIAFYDVGLVTSEHVGIERTAQELFGRVEPHGSRANQYTRRFLDLAQDRPHAGEVCEAARAVLENGPVVEKAVADFMNASGILPSDHPPIRFRPARHDSGEFTVDTNIEFERLANNAQVAGGPINPARLIAFVANSLSTLLAAAECRADLDTNPLDSTLLNAHLQGVLARRTQASEALLRLQQMTLRRGNAVADVINAGQRSFDDVVGLLDKAQRFHRWLHDQEPNADLIHEYYRQVTEQTWIAELPAKTFRWAFATATGMVFGGLTGTLVGAAVGAFDTFLLDKMLGGWRPNHFVDGELREFVAPRPR